MQTALLTVEFASTTPLASRLEGFGRAGGDVTVMMWMDHPDARQSSPRIVGSTARYDGRTHLATQIATISLAKGLGDIWNARASMIPLGRGDIGYHRRSVHA